MADEELEHRVSELERDHRLSRWYIGRVDRDLAEIAATQTEQSETLARIETKLVEHGHRQDVITDQLKLITQTLGTVLRRLPPADDEPNDGDPDVSE